MSHLKKGKTVWIARHGNRADFVDRSWPQTAARPHDPPLSADGNVQAQLLGKRMKRETVTHLFCSPFLRTMETASHVADQINLPIKIEHGAGEFLNPDWFKRAPEFLTSEEISQKFPRIDLTYTSRGAWKFPEHDEQSHCWPRAGKTMRRLVEDFDGDLMVVCHGATMLGLTYGLLEKFPFINCGLTCVVKVVYNGERWVMELNGCASHLV
jgi:broad specificity phosphatase PhoE